MKPFDSPEERNDARVDFLNDLADLLEKHDADIDLRTIGGFQSYQKIDVNVHGDVYDGGDLLDADTARRMSQRASERTP